MFGTWSVGLLAKPHRKTWHAAVHGLLITVTHMNLWGIKGSGSLSSASADVSESDRLRCRASFKGTDKQFCQLWLDCMADSPGDRYEEEAPLQLKQADIHRIAKPKVRRADFAAWLSACLRSLRCE